jgi:hypothetical protein
VYDDTGLVLAIKEMSLQKGKGVSFVEDFGYRVPKIITITSSQSQLKGTQGNAPSVSFLMTATTVTTIPVDYTAAPTATSTTVMKAAPKLPELLDGSLIRAEGDYKVYITNGPYKRWIQSAEIFNFYGHLNFAVVQVVSPATLSLYKDAWLVRAADDPKVYEINGDGTRHWLDMTPEKFSATGRRGDMGYVINKSELLWYKEGSSVK